MKAAIYHAKGRGIRFEEHEPGQILMNLFNEAYSYAGEVDGSGHPDEAFDLSQNTKADWASKPCRSTAVGDLLVIDGKLFQVACVGSNRPFSGWQEAAVVRILSESEAYDDDA